jgi:hypothetical protein
MQNENDIIEINIPFPPLGLLVFLFHVITINIIVSKVIFERQILVWRDDFNRCVGVFEKKYMVIFLLCP